LETEAGVAAESGEESVCRSDELIRQKRTTTTTANATVAVASTYLVCHHRRLSRGTRLPG
jgi:hypothetical protein